MTSAQKSLDRKNIPEILRDPEGKHLRVFPVAFPLPTALTKENL